MRNILKLKLVSFIINNHVYKVKFTIFLYKMIFLYSFDEKIVFFSKKLYILMKKMNFLMKKMNFLMKK
ncbi:MAG: hypothetical protein CMP68_05005 [Flavobacteriales bacterium]|nr:hypothetical protein [Flavobacteriales bacterium]